MIESATNQSGIAQDSTPSASSEIALNASAKAIQRATTEPAKRGRGRPRKIAGSPVSSPGISDSAPLDNSPPVPLVDVDTIKKSVSGILATLNSFIVNKVEAGAKRVSDDAILVKECVGSVEMTVAEQDNISALAALVFAKHQIAAQYAPEMFLVIAAGGYGLRVAAMIRKLDGLEKAKNQIPEQEKKP